MLRVSKRLFELPRVQGDQQLRPEISHYLESVCLPFEKGIHLCPLPLLQQVDRQLKEFSERRPELVESFVAVYPALCAQARIATPRPARSARFPAARPRSRCVLVSWRFISFGVPEKLREIAPELWDEERNKVAQLMTEAASEAQQVMRAAMAELVQHLADRLQTANDGKPVRLHKSAVSKLLNFWTPSIFVTSRTMRS